VQLSSSIILSISSRLHLKLKFLIPSPRPLFPRPLGGAPEDYWGGGGVGCWFLLNCIIFIRLAPMLSLSS
jgi:hypothetical protein